MPDAAFLFVRKKDGSYKLTQSGRPSFDQKHVLQPLLQRIADEHDIPAPETSRGITTSRKFWEDFRGSHEFIDAFCDLEELGKLYTFFNRLDSEEIHPRYNPLVKTGRSSSSNPNFQNMPKGDGFAEPGRQILHCTFGSVLTDAELGAAVRSVLESHPDTYTEVLAGHFSRHLDALRLDALSTSDAETLY